MTFRQSFAWWSFALHHELGPDFLATAADVGCQGVDFLPETLWPAARGLGLNLVIIDGHDSIERGFNERSHHAELQDQVRHALDLAVDNGVLNLSVSGGDQMLASDRDAISACVDGLAPLAAEAADAGVGLLLEPLNSKVDHADHQCDTTAWGAAVVDKVGSPHLRLLHDFYHMQIMEGDLLRTLAANIHRIGHFHTAGVPGRRDLDDRQEVNWVAIANALRGHGYLGYVGHEFIPRADPASALKRAYQLFQAT